MSGQNLVECVPNFSEGRDQTIIRAIANAIEQVADIKLLDIDPGEGANRTVMTFVGPTEAVGEAAFQAIRTASELIDMRQQKGTHPRLGATDVCPFIPLAGTEMATCVDLAVRVGERVGRELSIPVYLYENAAQQPNRENLADIRKGEYEGLPDKLLNPAWRPDFGPAEFNAKAGATVIGARNFLIAYNVNLNTKDKNPAQIIAIKIRERGPLLRDEKGRVFRDRAGNPVYKQGLLKAIKAVGWFIDEYERAQISMNLVNYKITPPHVAFEECRRQAELLGIKVTGSELIGLIPLEAILEAGVFYLQQRSKSITVDEIEIIQAAIDGLGLDDLAEFNPHQKILEYRLLSV